MAFYSCGAGADLSARSLRMTPGDLFPGPDGIMPLGFVWRASCFFPIISPQRAFVA
jgi:hypothetical protein